MGKLNCSSCIYSNEISQLIFTPENENNNNPIQNNIIQEEKFLEIISQFYSTKNYHIQKITSQEFSELLTSRTKKILDEYEDKIDDFKDLINNNKSIGPLKFIFKNKYKDKEEEKSNSENNSLEFYYDGDFNGEGIINGKGTKIMQNKYVYKGNFLNDEYNGKGILIKDNAYIFGNWINGECKGKVLYKVDNEFEYEGNFENKKKNGCGIEKYNDGSQYEGNFIDNKKNGKGKYKFINGEIYEGNFKNDLYNGEGKYIWSQENRKYEGEFKNGIIDGKGIYTYEDGSIFNGIFKNGLKNGEGYIEFLDGKKYFGNWVNGELYGNGYFVNGNEKIEFMYRHGKVISTNANNEEDINNNNNLSLISNNEEKLMNTDNIKFNKESFFGDNNIINVNKYICSICDYFFVEPLKCMECSNNFCKKCNKGKTCPNCNNNKFEINDSLIKEMNENVKIKCYRCDKILDYKESLNHFH